jgi:hypothetical protein
MGEKRAMHYLIQILAVMTIIGVAHGWATSSGNDYIGRKSQGGIIDASIILEKIETGESVHCIHKTIEGNLYLRDINLSKVHLVMGSLKESPFRILHKDLKIVDSVLDLLDCLIKGNVDFSDARFLGRIGFMGCTFSGETKFFGSQFNQSSSFIHCKFNRYINFNSSRFNQSAYFRTSQFGSYTGFSGCQFIDSVIFNEAQFSQSAYFEGTQFNQSASFINSQFNQSVDFSGSQFNKKADFSLSRFNKSENFTLSQFQKDALFGRSYMKSANFNQTAFSGDLSFEGSQIDSLSLTRAEFSKIFMRWKSIGHLAYDETTYLLLMSNFKNFNFLDDANECYYDYRNDRRATLPLLYQPVDYAFMLLYGYGVKPERPVIWSLRFMAFFAALFWWRQGILPVREGEPAEEANRFSLLEAAAFSAMTFLSGGKPVFDPPEYRIASGRPWRDVQISKALFILERLLGMVLIIMFAIAVGKTIILGGG